MILRNKNRRISGIVFAACSLLLSVKSFAKTPNVVVFLVDDLGYMDVGANNPNCFYDTPNIDRLAKTGMRFTDGYAANPVCSPTRYSLLTGKYPTRVRATIFCPTRRRILDGPGSRPSRSRQRGRLRADRCRSRPRRSRLGRTRGTGGSPRAL